MQGGYPLIHNSWWLRDYGYYYPDFACDIAGDRLLHAVDRHDADLPVYRANVAGLLARLAPTHAENIALHEGLVRALVP